MLYSYPLIYYIDTDQYGMDEVDVGNLDVIPDGKTSELVKSEIAVYLEILFQEMINQS